MLLTWTFRSSSVAENIPSNYDPWLYLCCSLTGTVIDNTHCTESKQLSGPSSRLSIILIFQWYRITLWSLERDNIMISSVVDKPILIERYSKSSHIVTMLWAEDKTHMWVTGRSQYPKYNPWLTTFIAQEVKYCDRTKSKALLLTVTNFYK